MNMSPFRGPTWALFVTVLSSAVACAQLDVSLPGVSGVYDEGVITGGVIIPVTSGAADAVLVVVGSQVAGEESSGCPPSAPYATGALLYLYMTLDGSTPDVDGFVALAALDGDFVAELPLHSANSPYGPLETLGGSYSFELHVLPGGSPVCGITHRMPVVTINSANVVSRAGVAVEGLTWGAIKGLFR